MRRAALLLLFLPALAAAARADAEALARHLEALTRHPTRLVGTTGHDAAADYIEARFRELGLEDVQRVATRVVVPHVRAATLTFAGDGRVLRLFPLWPNLVRLPATGPQGLEGRLVYAGASEPSEYDGLAVRGSIVLLDWDCGSRWQYAAQLGAAAVVFIEPETALRHQAAAKLTRAPMRIPRFWIPRAAGLALAEEARRAAPRVRVRSRMQWIDADAPTLLARLPGSDPAAAGEAVFVQAHYDSMSVVPELAPGAEQACGMAALLDLAGRLRRDPPRRTVVFVASSAHWLALQGIVDFIARGDYQAGRPYSLRWPGLGLVFDRWMMVSLELSSRTDRLGLHVANRDVFFNTGPAQPRIARLARAGREIDAAVEAACARAGLPPKVHFFNGIVPPLGRRLDEREPGGIPFDAEAVDLRGELGFGLITLDDDRPRLDTPHDTRDAVSLPNLARQVHLCEAIVRHLGSAPALPPNVDPWPRDNMSRVTGRVLTHGEVGFIADVPVADALVLPVRHLEHTLGGVRTDRIARAGVSGRYELRGLEIREYGWPPAKVRLEAFYCDPRTGEIVFASDLGAKGHGTLPNTLLPSSTEHQRELVVFPCAPVDVYDTFCAKELVPAWPSRLAVLNALTDTEPQTYGAFFQERNVPAPASAFQTIPESCGVVFVPHGESFKIVTYNFLGSPQLLLVGAAGVDEGTGAEHFALGRGLAPRPGLVLGDVPLRSAANMYTLARHRLDTFNAYGIRNEHLGAVLEEGKALLAQAEAARAELAHSTAGRLAQAAWATLAKSYPVVKNTADDMVLAVMFYLAMLLPFTVFSERILFGHPDIRKRLATMAAIFLLVFLALRYVHPAFDITVTPLLLLLAFVIFVLSGGVTVIVLRKFQTQTRQLREELGEIHVADIGRLSAGTIAFSLGVSNLRNRPVRTVLTSGTIVLLTFCVLSFTSVRSYLGYRKVSLPGTATYHGMLVADIAGAPLPQARYRELAERYRGEPGVLVVPRVWHWGRGGGSASGESYIDVRGASPGAEPYPVSALLQLSPREREVTGLDRALVAGRWFAEDDTDAAIVPASLARVLALADPDTGAATVEIRAHVYRVVGVYDEQRLQRVEDLDGFPVAPLDRQLSQGGVDSLRAARQAGRALTETDLSRMKRLSPDQFLLIGDRSRTVPPLPVELGAPFPDSLLASVAVAFRSSERAEAAVRDLVARTTYTVFSGLEGRRYLYSAQEATSLKGLGGLWAPIGITVLIVLNTMMGAVHERRREIGIFSSLGLAPSHIGFLFLAEACVYANLAIVLGYLFGQGLGKVITALDLLPGLTLNYSALSAVFTSVVIMVIVLLSSSYPAYLGSRLAAPSVERTWKLPAPQGDRFEIDLPFTVGREEAQGLFRYLHEYLDAHAQYMMGRFYVDGLRLVDEGRPVLSCKVWLAPYDLGVSQTLHLAARESLVGGFFEFRLSLARLEGDVRSWTRTNHLFLGALRKQLLVWRTLTPAQRETYTRPEAADARR